MRTELRVKFFIRMNREGSTLSGMLDTIGTLISYCLQYGVPLQSLVDKLSGMSFEPSGFSTNEDIPEVKSLIDYIFLWLEKEFLNDNHK